MAKTKKNKTDYKQARQELRKWLVKWTGCGIQTSKSGLYPCGTCFMFLLDSIGLKAHKKEYQEHNDDYDRCNEVWRALLQIRNAKLK